MTEFEVAEERDSLGHAHVAIGFEAHISDWSSRVNNTHNVFCDYVQAWCLICCGSNNADWKCEDKSEGTSKDESPPWHLNLIVQGDAEY